MSQRQVDEHRATLEAFEREMDTGIHNVDSTAYGPTPRNGENDNSALEAPLLDWAGVSTNMAPANSVGNIRLFSKTKNQKITKWLRSRIPLERDLMSPSRGKKRSHDTELQRPVRDSECLELSTLEGATVQYEDSVRSCSKQEPNTGPYTSTPYKGNTRSKDTLSLIKTSCNNKGDETLQILISLESESMSPTSSSPHNKRRKIDLSHTTSSTDISETDFFKTVMETQNPIDLDDTLSFQRKLEIFLEREASPPNEEQSLPMPNIETIWESKNQRIDTETEIENKTNVLSSISQAHTTLP